MKIATLACVLTLLAGGSARAQQNPTLDERREPQASISSDRPDKHAPVARSVRGIVLSSDNKPVPGAAIQLKNVKTNKVLIAVVAPNGTYLFSPIDPKTEYEVSAIRSGYVTATKTISEFDTRKVAVTDFKLIAVPPSGSAAPTSKQ